MEACPKQIITFSIIHVKLFVSLSLESISKPVTRIIAVDEQTEEAIVVKKFEQTKEHFEALFDALRVNVTQKTMFTKKKNMPILMGNSKINL